MPGAELSIRLAAVWTVHCIEMLPQTSLAARLQQHAGPTKVRLA